MRVLFLHGYGSSSETDKFKAITSNKVTHKFCPYIEYNKTDFLSLFTELSHIVEKFRPDLIIGHSLGGYWAKVMSNAYHIPCILLNPQLFPKKKYGFPNLDKSDFETGVWAYSYLESGDDIIDYEKTKLILENYTDLEIYEGGHHRIKNLDSINSIIEKHSRIDGIYD